MAKYEETSFQNYNRTKVNKERFNYLVEKYKQDCLNRSEYREFVDMLSEPGAVEILDKLLTNFWEESEPVLQLVPESQPQPKPKSESEPQHYLWWGIAASFILLAGFFFYYWGTPDILGNREIVYGTGFGERLEIDLDDGSHITLNANSELRWSEDWERNKSRQAILTGEAFFEVEKQKGIPFTVNTNDVAVEVLGTSFNVDTREEETEVYLDEGKVNLKLKDDLPDQQESEEQQIIMKPGDQVRYSARENIVKKTEGQDMITAAAWKNNVLNFKNMEFRDVLELLRDIYGQSFECTDGALLNKPMVIGVPYSDWEAVRQALELSLNIEFQKTANRRYVIKSMK